MGLQARRFQEAVWRHSRHARGARSRMRFPILVSEALYLIEQIGRHHGAPQLGPDGFRKLAPFGYGLDEVNGVRYSPNGKWLATAHQDGRIIVHSAATGDAVFAAQLHLSGVGGARRVAWSSKGDWLVSCGEDGRVACVPYPKGKQQILLLTTDKAVWSVAWSPDNNWIAAVGEEGRAWIWSTSFLHSLSGTKAASAEQTHPDHATSAPSPKARAHKKFSPFHWLHKKSDETDRR